jgi:TRAP-type C4-dicarboxylate transport system permease small subunit
VNQLLRRYTKVLEATMTLGLAVMVVLVFGNVVLRYLFNSGIAVSEELSRWIFVWVTMLGAIVALREHAHLGTDALVTRLSLRGKVVCLLAGYLLMIGTCVLLLSGSLEQTKINLNVDAPSSGAPVAVFYASGVVFAVSAILILLNDLFRLATGKATVEQLMVVRDSEDTA